MTAPVPAPAPAPAPGTAPAPAPAPARNRVGIAALVLVLVAIALPILGFVAFAIAASVEGAEGDDLGYAFLGAFFLAAAGTAFVAPLAIAGVVLGIVSLLRTGKRKLQGILAIVFGALPAVAVAGLPTAIDSVF